MDMELPSGRELVEEIYAKKDAEIDALREQNRVLRCALESIAKNTCCAPCREAALVAQAALTATSQPTKPQGRMHACDIPGCVSCGNPEDATSQEGQHG